MLKRALVRMMTGLALTAAIAGCHNGPPPEETWKLEGAVNTWVELSKPVVTIHRGETTIAGNVRRKPGVTGDVVGRVDITILGPDGGSLVWLPALITPNPIPTAGRGESQYVVHYGYIPPANSTIQVRFVDRETAKREDVDDTEKKATTALHGAPGEFSDKGTRLYVGW